MKVLDLFCGTKSLEKPCLDLGYEYFGIEREAEYVEIAERRIQEAQLQPRLPLEAESDQLTAHSDIERQDDKWIPEVQE